MFLPQLVDLFFEETDFSLGAVVLASEADGYPGRLSVGTVLLFLVVIAERFLLDDQGGVILAE